MSITIAEEKQRLRQVVLVDKKSTTCACCGQHVSVYKRTINGPACSVLIIMYKFFGKEYVHVQKDFAKRGVVAPAMDYIQLSRWGLIEPKTSERDPEAKDAGYWRVTDIGERFIKCLHTVPKHAFVYNNKTYAWSHEVVNIKQALGTKFSYEELFKI